MSIFTKIKKSIMKSINDGKRCFIIYPYNEIGIMVQDILEKCFDIKAIVIVDKELAKYNNKILNIEQIKERDYQNYACIITYKDGIYYDEIRSCAKRYLREDQIIDLFPNINRPKVGKYSNGPLCLSEHVESIGAFCSFAVGTCAHQNHAMDCITTHGIIYNGLPDYHAANKTKWYLPGIEPHGKGAKNNKVIIGNDVWLGKNVIITNGVKIGDGVIAGAGAVITQDVPDYAIVGGVPAKILRYRYTPEQIEALKRIQWWNWSDDEIRERYEDLYLPIEAFVEKYDTK